MGKGAGAAEALAWHAATCGTSVQEDAEELSSFSAHVQCPVSRVLSARRCGGVEQLQCTFLVSSVQSTRGHKSMGHVRRQLVAVARKKLSAVNSRQEVVGGV